MHPVLIQGTSALSDFRLKQLTESFSTARSDLENIRIKAEFVYIVQANQTLDETSLSQSYKLLSAEKLFEQTGGFFCDARKSHLFPMVLQSHRYISELWDPSYSTCRKRHLLHHSSWRK